MFVFIFFLCIDIIMFIFLHLFQILGIIFFLLLYIEPCLETMLYDSLLILSINIPSLSSVSDMNQLTIWFCFITRLAHSWWFWNTEQKTEVITTLLTNFAKIRLSWGRLMQREDRMSFTITMMKNIISLLRDE